MLAIWVIYDHPRDYPNHFVLRRQCVEDNGTISFDIHCHLTRSLEEARKLIPPGLACFHRSEGDDPFIVESWL